MKGNTEIYAKMSKDSAEEVKKTFHFKRAIVAYENKTVKNNVQKMLKLKIY